MRLIDADALKADYGMKDDCEDCEKELKGYVKQCQYDAVYTKMDFCGWIDAMPTIDSERKKGKWDFIGNQLFKCTSCEKVYSQDQFYALQTYYSDPEFPNYCPNCGADMREGEKE